MKNVTGWVIECKVPNSPHILHYYDCVGKTFTRHVFIYDTQKYATDTLQRINNDVTIYKDQCAVVPILYTLKRPVYKWFMASTEGLGDYLCVVGKNDDYIIDTLTREMNQGNVTREINVWYIKKEVPCES